jgi:ABC-type phosphate transport system substrate-binding protein
MLGNKKPIFGHILVVLVLFVTYSPFITATEIVVNKSVPTVDYSTADIRAIFTMKKRVWPNNRQIKVYTLSDTSPLHKDFVKNVLQMFPHQIRRIWDRLTFSGTGGAPIELESEQEMIDKIANTADSIGYANSKPENENVRAVADH